MQTQKVIGVSLGGRVGRADGLVMVVVVRIIRAPGQSATVGKKSQRSSKFPTALSDHKTVPNPTSPSLLADAEGRGNQNHSLVLFHSHAQCRNDFLTRCLCGELCPLRTKHTHSVRGGAWIRSKYCSPPLTVAKAKPGRGWDRPEWTREGPF